MTATVRGASLFVALVLLFLSLPLAAQDVITVGSVVASGLAAEVPVYVKDAGGTPLGVDRPAGSKIQAFSIKVDYAPASAVQSVSFTRAGVTKNLNPTFETAPSNSGSISLVVSFDETTNPIPFTLNGTAQVARLLFTLSPSAAPSSTITLTLDPSLTQLTDSGGSAATKETVAKGSLALVDGSIQIPALTVSLSPTARGITPGGSATLTANLSATAASDTTVALSSSNTSVATVPSSVVVPAGSRSASFRVNGIAIGDATVTATLGTSTSTAGISVADAPAQCLTPAAPQLTAPASADIGATYTVSWNTVDDATEYILEEATDAAFTAPSTRTVTGTSATFVHTTGGVRHHYRLRARNHAGTCDLLSNYSTAVSVLINDAPVPTTRIVTVVGSLPGSFGSYFRTAFQMHNPHASAVSGRIVFHPANAAGTASDPALPFTLGPGKTLSYADLLPAMNVAQGLGSADVVADAGSPFPLVLARVFNDGGPAGTSGLGEEALPLDRALQTGDRAVLFAPDDVQRFRLNVGIRTLNAGASMNITVRDKDGLTVRTSTRSYEPVFFTQVASAALLDGYALTGGETIAFQITSGSVVVYGATTDNVTNDPSVQFANRID